jgi:hypothetical protein
MGRSGVVGAAAVPGVECTMLTGGVEVDDGVKAGEDVQELPPGWFVLVHNTLLDEELLRLAVSIAVYTRSPIPVCCFIERDVACSMDTPCHRVEHPVHLGPLLVAEQHHPLAPCPQASSSEASLS